MKEGELNGEEKQKRNKNNKNEKHCETNKRKRMFTGG